MPMRPPRRPATTIRPAAGNSLGQSIGVPSQGSNFAANIYAAGNPNGLMAPQSVSNTGGSQAHTNLMPLSHARASASRCRGSSRRVTERRRPRGAPAPARLAFPAGGSNPRPDRGGFVSAHPLPSRPVERIWGRRDLPAGFGAPADVAIGEIWFEDPDPDAQLLVKYLFTAERLSIQVHPDDAAARAAGYKRGKDEALGGARRPSRTPRIGLGLHPCGLARRAGPGRARWLDRGAARLAAGRGGGHFLFARRAPSTPSAAACR